MSGLVPFLSKSGPFWSLFKKKMVPFWSLLGTYFLRDQTWPHCLGSIKLKAISFRVLTVWCRRYGVGGSFFAPKQLVCAQEHIFRHHPPFSEWNIVASLYFECSLKISGLKNFGLTSKIFLILRGT